MSPQEFKSAWKGQQYPPAPISFGRLERFSLSPRTKNFLAISGLPKYASPFLSFVEDSDDPIHGINKLTDSYIDLREYMADFPEWHNYVVIGSCRDGDPIAVDTTQQDIILQLDDEDDFKPTFFNSSIEAMAGFLILVQEFDASVIAECGEDAFRNSYFTDQQFGRLRDQMQEIDNRALTERGFWKEELQIMLNLRQEYLDHEAGIAKKP